MAVLTFRVRLRYESTKGSLGSEERSYFVQTLIYTFVDDQVFVTGMADVSQTPLFFVAPVELAHADMMPDDQVIFIMAAFNPRRSHLRLISVELCQLLFERRP